MFLSTFLYRGQARSRPDSRPDRDKGFTNEPEHGGVVSPSRASRPAPETSVGEVVFFWGLVSSESGNSASSPLARPRKTLERRTHPTPTRTHGRKHNRRDADVRTPEERSAAFPYLRCVLTSLLQLPYKCKREILCLHPKRERKGHKEYTDDEDTHKGHRQRRDRVRRRRNRRQSGCPTLSTDSSILELELEQPRRHEGGGYSSTLKEHLRSVCTKKTTE